MKKKDFVTLLLGVVGGLLFALGMCMALIEEWDAFWPGVVCAGAGLAVLIMIMLVAVRRKMSGKPMVKPGKRAVLSALLGIVGVAVFGAGMCMVMVWDMMLWGIVVGVAGIILLLCLIPAIEGLK